jgi:hypothetical protein
MELEPYKDALEFSTEHQLTSEPLKIDLLVIKKAPETVIEKNIARIFKRVNILEYKSPEDYFSLWNFHKVLSYTHLYASLNKTDVRDMTVSFIGMRYPRGLFSYFREGGCAVTGTSAGIYAVSGYPMAIQVIESKELPFEENQWLKALRDDLNTERAGAILGKSRGREGELGAYLCMLFRANPKTFEEVYRMKNDERALEEVLERLGLTAKWEERGEAKGVAIGEARGVAIGEAIGEKTAWEKFVGLLEQGYTVDQLKRMSPSVPSGN